MNNFISGVCGGIVIMAVVWFLCLSGCRNNDEVKTRMPVVNDTVSHVQVIWKEGNMEMVRIDGHVYLVGKISSSARGGSNGVSSFIHVSYCPCYSKEEEN